MSAPRLAGEPVSVCFAKPWCDSVQLSLFFRTESSILMTQWQKTQIQWDNGIMAVAQAPSSSRLAEARTFPRSMLAGSSTGWRQVILLRPILSMEWRVSFRMRNVVSSCFGRRTQNHCCRILTSWRKETSAATFNTHWTITRKKAWKRTFAFGGKDWHL